MLKAEKLDDACGQIIAFTAKKAGEVKYLHNFFRFSDVFASPQNISLL